MKMKLFITIILTLFCLNINSVNAETIDPSILNINVDTTTIRDVEQNEAMNPLTYISFSSSSDKSYPIVSYGFDDACPFTITTLGKTELVARKGNHIYYTLVDTSITRDIDCTMTMTIQYEGREVDMLANVKMSVYPTRTVLPQPTLLITEYEYTGSEVFPVLEGFNDNGMHRTNIYEKAIDAGEYKIFIELDNDRLYKFENTPATPLIYKFTINKKIETLSGNEYNGYVGKSLSTVSLPTGWTWDNPNILVKEGTNTYPASYNPTDTKNYEVVNGEEVSVVGTIIPTYTINITSDSGIKHSYGTSLIIEEKDSKDLIFNAIEGYRIKSVLVDGTEVLTNPVTTYTVSLTNVTKTSTIEIISEISHLKPTEGDNQVIDKSYIKEALFSFDLDFASFVYDYVKIGDVTITSGFRFVEGSVVLVLEENLLNTLEVGTHSVEIGLSGGKFLVSNLIITESNTINNPSTSDNVIMYIVLSLLSLGAIVSLNSKKNYKK